METFRKRDPIWVVEFDGCFTGGGLRLFSLEEGGEQRLRYAGSGNADYKLKGNSAYQNAMELLVVVVALVALARLGVRGETVRLRGDSVTVLEWAKKGRYNSGHAMTMGIVMVVVGEMFQLQISEDPQHMLSEDNYLCDSLSRFRAGKRGIRRGAGEATGTESPEGDTGGGAGCVGQIRVGAGSVERTELNMVGGGVGPCTFVFLFLRLTTRVLSCRVSREVVRQEEGGGGVGAVRSQEGRGFEAAQG